MKPLEKLIKIIKKKRKESDIANSLLRPIQFEAERLLKDEQSHSNN